MKFKFVKETKQETKKKEKKKGKVLSKTNNTQTNPTTNKALNPKQTAFPNKELETKPEKVKSKVKIKNFIKKNLKAKIQDKFRPNRTILVEMLHHNGTMSHMIISTKIHKFNYQDMTYIVDEDCKIYCNSSKLYMLRYHEGFAMPYKVDVSLREMKNNIPQNFDFNQIETSFNPYVLKDVLKMEYTKGVIQGAEVHEFIRKSFLMLIIVLIVCLTHLAVNAYMSKWI